MKRKIVDVNIKDIIERALNAKSYNDELIIVDLQGDGVLKTNFKSDVQLRFDTLSFILSCCGEIDININDTDYHFDSRVLLDISEVHVIRSLKLSPDFRGYHILMSKNFQYETMRGFKPISASNLIARYNYPVELIQEEEGAMLVVIIEQIKRDIDRTDHCYQREIIKNELKNFFLESLNIIMSRSKVAEKKPGLPKEEIIIRFIHLLTKHCREKHSVDFYARELCVTSSYLSRILKNFGGKPANIWIDDALMKEAKLYLRDQSLTISQVSDVLNFSDQSAFGKFFKKHCGVSPLNYRRTLL